MQLYMPAHDIKNVTNRKDTSVLFVLLQFLFFFSTSAPWLITSTRPNLHTCQ